MVLLCNFECSSQIKINHPWKSVGQIIPGNVSFFYMFHPNSLHSFHCLQHTLLKVRALDKSYKLKLKKKTGDKILIKIHKHSGSIKLGVTLKNTIKFVQKSGTGYGLDGPGIEFRWGEIFRTCPDRPWGPLSLLYKGYRLFPGGKERLGRDADSLPPSSAVVMKG